MTGPAAAPGWHRGQRPVGQAIAVTQSGACLEAVVDVMMRSGVAPGREMRGQGLRTLARDTSRGLRRGGSGPASLRPAGAGARGRTRRRPRADRRPPARRCPFDPHHHAVAVPAPERHVARELCQHGEQRVVQSQRVHRPLVLLRREAERERDVHQAQRGLDIEVQPSPAAGLRVEFPSGEAPFWTDQIASPCDRPSRQRRGQPGRHDQDRRAGVHRGLPHP